jgi:hypothetical protein
MPITGFEGAYYMVLKGLLEGLEWPIREIGRSIGGFGKAY